MSNQPDLSSLLPKIEEKQETALPPDDDSMEALGILLESVQASLQPVKDVLEKTRKEVNRLTIENRILKNRMDMVEQINAYLCLKDPELKERMQRMAAMAEAANEMEKADANSQQILSNVPTPA